MDSTRRTLLTTGVAAAAAVAAPRAFAQQTGKGDAAMPFYEKGNVRIHYQEAGSGFPLLLIPGGGLHSTISFFARAPFNAIEEFKNEYRCITSDCATPTAASPPARSRSSAPGTRTPMTSLA